MTPTWSFPLFPQDLTNHDRLTSPQGAFGYKRSYYFHQGVDLYVKGGAPVLAVEDSRVVAIVDFTGGPNEPHWLHTQAVLLEGASGVVCYGEVMPKYWLEIGNEVKAGDKFANVVPVIPKGDERPDIYGHSRYMLHLEWHKHGSTDSVHWNHVVRPYECPGDGGCAQCGASCGENHAEVCTAQPNQLLDPTEPLMAAWKKMLRIGGCNPDDSRGQ